MSHLKSFCKHKQLHYASSRVRKLFTSFFKIFFYSHRTSFPTLDFENEMADVGCEVHVFDPTQKATRFLPRAQHTGDIKRNVVFHRITLDWRDIVPELDLFGPPSLRAKNLQTIMTELGHTEVSKRTTCTRCTMKNKYRSTTLRIPITPNISVLCRQKIVKDYVYCLYGAFQ